MGLVCVSLFAVADMGWEAFILPQPRQCDVWRRLG